MTTKDSARAILDEIGGAQNVAALQHCSTRLRFNLVDDAKADDKALGEIPGVIGVVRGAQTQIIVGSNVADYFREIEKLRGGRAAASGVGRRQPLTWRRGGSIIMDFVVGVFVPIVPAIAGAGLFMSLLVAIEALGWLPADSPTLQVLGAIPDAVFFFLPMLVAYTTARKLNVNIPLALGIVSLLLFPAFTELMNSDTGASMFGLAIPVVQYNAQVFPSILTVLLLWGVEKVATRISPAPVRTFLVPLICFVVVAPAMIFLLGPLGFWIGSLLTGAMLWLYGTLGWVAIAVLAAALPFVIAVGMHKTFIPPTVQTVADQGYDPFYLVASLAHNIAEAGSTLAIAMRTKNQTLRATALSGGISAVFGITEPALYGVTLQNRRALFAVIPGAFVGGAFLGLTAVQAFALVSPGLASISMFVDAADPWNLVWAIVGALLSFAISFTISAITWKDSDSATLRAFGANEDAAGATGTGIAEGAVRAPLTGDVVALSAVDDPVFSGGVLGEGVAIRPTDGEVRAPISGEVVSLLDSKHAIGIRGSDGLEVLVHVGIDTVQLGGKHFEALISQGDVVEAGQPLVRADLEAIAAAGFDTTTPVVVLNGEDRDLADVMTGPVSAGDILYSVAMKKEVSGGTA